MSEIQESNGFSVEDARRMSSHRENPWIARFEKYIKDAAADGDHGVLLCYVDCCDANAHAALSALERRGLTIVRRREVIDGYLQTPGYYAEW